MKATLSAKLSEEKRIGGRGKGRAPAEQSRAEHEHEHEHEHTRAADKVAPLIQVVRSSNLSEGDSCANRH